MKSDGLDRCEKAFERLKAGNSHNSKFVNIPSNDITPSVVSIEAGFDKGYLKTSRDRHKPLIALIRTYAKSQEKHSKHKTALNRESKRRNEAELILNQTKAKLESALTDNLRLITRVQYLEKEFGISLSQ